MYKNILIATDGSALADRGLDHGLGLAKALGAKVTITQVEVPLSSFEVEALVAGMSFDTEDELTRVAVEKVRANAEAKAAATGVAVSFVRVGDSEPAHGILRVASEQGCDLIVMASHAREGLPRLVLGSETAKVLSHSTLPVLVIR